MKTGSGDPPDPGSARPGAISKAYGFLRRSLDQRDDGPGLPVTEPSSTSNTTDAHNGIDASNNGNGAVGSDAEKSAKPSGQGFFDAAHPAGQEAPASSSQEERQGAFLETKREPDNAAANNFNTPNLEDDHDVSSHGEGDSSMPKQGTKMSRFWKEFVRSFWLVTLHSPLNFLLVFVPVGIAVAQIPGINAGIVFGMNAIAVIPLAGLLAHATESVARKMGDALGALLNVTFGNAVELIIFIIALADGQIRIVQASLLGSILANLLLILGMCFFLGGLRYREQIYNSTVTQMSACLLSLAVTSLVLPTAFHASFADTDEADRQSLKISRGTSVILLLVYILYLLFQLKSHAYLYESMPQHLVDAESTPGPAAAWLDSSSSDDSSSSSSDSDDSSHSRDTMRKKMKKVLRGRRRRKSSMTSLDTADAAFTRSSSFATTNASPMEENGSEGSNSRPFANPTFARDDAHEHAIEDEKDHHRKRRHHMRHKHRKHKKHQQSRGDGGDLEPTISERPEPRGRDEGEPRRVDFAVMDQSAENEATPSEGAAPGAAKRPFPALRGMSVKNVKNLAPSVFVQKPGEDLTRTRTGQVPRVRYGIRRTNSLPDRLSQNGRQPGTMFPSRVSTLQTVSSGTGAVPLPDDGHDGEHLTQTAAIILLLITTALVATCAEFLVDSIEDVTNSSSVGETFIGLIILPIVGNAAEHVTAITVAMKNKMDLAIGVAVGSSIQIALFITPLVVILGWIMEKDMTLYFTLFETICLFVSAFIVNFLVLDGRSNYLEGALLCAVYVIIATISYFYPDPDQASEWGA